MDEPRRPEAEDSPYLKLPWPLVAGGLAAVLLVALAAGLLANRFIRQPTAVLPPPTPVSIAAGPTGTSATAVGPTTVGPTATTGLAQPTAPNETPQLTATETPPQPMEVRATATPQPVVAAAATAPVGADPTARPTVSPALLKEIDEAYERYWEVRAEALFDLDESRLPEVMEGEHLAAVERFIQQLRTENRAVETAVEHSYLLADVSLESVQIVDTYVDNSVYVDPQTGARLTEPIGNTSKELYRMTKTDGTWRVVSLVRSP